MPPNNPKIYHITHLSNLASIVNAGSISSDARRIALGLANTNVGMTSIKQRRLDLNVDCHPGSRVGDYVPFYFCPRSIMLYLIFRGNHPELTYKGGQGPIIHIQADLTYVVQWCAINHCRWAFSTSNAGAYYTNFYKALDQLGQVNWGAVASNDFRDATIKEGKQAEFLLHDQFPWTLIEHIGVINDNTATTVNAILKNASHRPVVSVQKGWYY